MEIIKNCLSAAFENYFIYLFFAAFALADILIERIFYAKQFNSTERFNFYFFSTVINLIFGNAASLAYSFSGKGNRLYMAVFALVSFFAGAAASFVLKKLILSLRKNKLSEIIKNNFVGIGSFIIFCAKYILCVPINVDPWHSWCYATDYSMGFSSRFLAGQILSFFTGDFVSEKAIYIFCFIAGLLLIFITSALLNAAVKKADEKTKLAVFFICACFVACPFNIISLFSVLNFGKLETYGFILSFSGIYLFNKIKNIPLKYSVITFLSIISIMFYQGNVFLCYNLMLIIMIYDIFEAERLNKSKCVCGLISVLITFVVFLKFQLFKGIKFGTAEEMAKAISERTDAEFWKAPIEFEYFYDLKKAYELVSDYLGDMAREKLLIELVMVLPLLYLIAAIIFRFFNVNKNELHSGVTVRVRNILCVLTSLLIVPQFILNIDWARWLVALTVFFFTFILYFNYKGDASMNTVLERLSVSIKKHPYVFVLLVVFLGIFSEVQEKFYPDVQKLFEFAANVLRG